MTYGAAVLALVASACTFYTGCPDQPANNSPGSGNSSSNGGSSSGGSPSPGGGSSSAGSSAEGGSAGEGDGPRKWQEVAGTLVGRDAGCGVVFISSHPGRDQLLIGLSSFGLWESDVDAEWSPLGNSGLSAMIQNGVSWVAYDPEDPDTFYEAGIYDGPGGFKTTDGGKTFTPLGNLKHVDSIAIDFGDPKRQTMIAGPHERAGAIIKSTDGGETWTDIDNLPEGFGYSNTVLLVDAQTYLVGVTTGIVRTTDGGQSWDVVSRIGGHQMPLVASDGSIYWNAEGDQGLVMSSDQGESWSRIVGGGVLNASRPPMELPDGRLAAFQDSRIVISSNQGVSWTPVGEQVPFMIKGSTYSAARKAFYVTTDTCDRPIPGDAILKLDFDWEVE